MTDLQHLIKLKKIWLRAHHTPQCWKVRDVFFHWEPSSCLHTCLDCQASAFRQRSLFSFKTSSIVWMVVTWVCSLGGGHYDLYFMLQLKRKQGFIWGPLLQIISINVCCNQVSMSFKSGKMLIHIFIERWSAWSSIFLVCFLFACVLFVPPTSFWGAEDVTRGRGHAKPMLHSWAAPTVPAIWFPCKTLRSLPW